MTKSKIGRNDPCHCGSGQKYKRCCLEKDQRAESAVLAQAATERLAASAHHHHHHHAHCDFCGDTFGDDDADELTAASNAIVDMVHDGKLDEAEQAARDFLVRFPEVHDGYDRLGMVYEARGDNKQAVINCKVADLDTEGAFAFVRLSVTVGVAASQLNATLLGFYPRYEDGAQFNQAAVVQVN